MWRFEALRRVPLFDKLTDKQKSQLASAMQQITVPKGEAIVTQVRQPHKVAKRHTTSLAAAAGTKKLVPESCLLNDDNAMRKV